MPGATLPPRLGRELRRWGALLALAGLALPTVTAAREARERDLATLAALHAGITAAGAGPLLPGPDWEAVVVEPADPAPPAPWEALELEPDGKPLPTPLPPGPAPVTDGAPAPASAPPAPASAPPAPASAPAAPPPAPATAAAGPGVRGVPVTNVRPMPVPTQREPLRKVLVRYAQENGLPADLVMALAWVESSWRVGATSHAGAIGVMQLMPNTVTFTSRNLLGLDHNLDPRSASSNIRMGTRFLRHLVDRNGGNYRRALVAYNQGITSLRSKGAYPMAEAYADRILALRSRFRQA